MVIGKYVLDTSSCRKIVEKNPITSVRYYVPITEVYLLGLLKQEQLWRTSKTVAEELRASQPGVQILRYVESKLSRRGMMGGLRFCTYSTLAFTRGQNLCRLLYHFYLQSSRVVTGRH